MRGLRFVATNTYNKMYTNHYIYDAFLTGLRVGTCNVNVSRDVAYLNYLYVQPSLRNRYIGSSLLNYTEEFLWNNNVSFINLHVLSNESNYLTDFYIKHNYNTINKLDNVYDDGENIFDMIHMNKIKDMDDNIVGGYRPQLHPQARLFNFKFISL